LLSAFLALALMLAEGCTTYNACRSISEAEGALSQGKAPGRSVREVEAGPVSSLEARQRLALVMESILRGDFSYGSVKSELADIRDKSQAPDHLKTEAGYMLVLVERMEGLSKVAARSRECARENEEIKKTLETARKEQDDLKKQLEELRFKLKKLEEINIEALKRRGAK